MSETSLNHTALEGGTQVLPPCLGPRGAHCPWLADCGYSASLRPQVSWSPLLFYETGEQGVLVMDFGFSLGNRAKCVSLPSCFLKDASLLPNSSEPGPHTAPTKELGGPAAVLGTNRCPEHLNRSVPLLLRVAWSRGCSGSMQVSPRGQGAGLPPAGIPSW